MIALAIERLTSKQKQILLHLQDNGQKTNVTRLVSLLSDELDCSKTTVWNNIRALKKARLVKYGSLAEPGMPTTLTDAGLLLSKKLLERLT